MKAFPSIKKGGWGNFFLGVFILLLIIPQTGQPIQVALNRLKVLVWSPSVEKAETMEKVSAFSYPTLGLDGQRVSHSIGKDKVTFLSFWATWCAPCVAELPSIAALHKDYQDHINFVLVTRERPEVVNAFLDKKGLDLPVYFPSVEVPEVLRSNKLPTNYLIDGEGKILIKETGAADWGSTKVREVLEELLEE